MAPEARGRSVEIDQRAEGRGASSGGKAVRSSHRTRLSRRWGAAEPHRRRRALDAAELMNRELAGPRFERVRATAGRKAPDSDRRAGWRARLIPRAGTTTVRRSGFSRRRYPLARGQMGRKMKLTISLDSKVWSRRSGGRSSRTTPWRRSCGILKDYADGGPSRGEGGDARSRGSARRRWRVSCGSRASSARSRRQSEPLAAAGSGDGRAMSCTIGAPPLRPRRAGSERNGILGRGSFRGGAAILNHLPWP